MWTVVAMWTVKLDDILVETWTDFCGQTKEETKGNNKDHLGGSVLKKRVLALEVFVNFVALYKMITNWKVGEVVEIEGLLNLERGIKPKPVSPAFNATSKSTPALNIQTQPRHRHMVGFVNAPPH